MKTNRLTEIDALRGIAAMGVCLFHFSLYANNAGVFSFRFLRYGATGVDLFFMISGFVILLSMESRPTQKAFWFARFKRIMPAYWLSLIIALMIYYFFNSFDFQAFFRWNHLIGNMLMLQPLFRSGELVGVYWTLYVELWFYTTVSLVWLLGWKDYLERILWLGLITTGVLNGWYFFSSASFGIFVPLRAILPLVTCFGFFAAGVTFYRIYMLGWSVNRVSLLAACLVMVALTQFTGGHFNTYLTLPWRLLCNAVFYSLFVLVLIKRAGFLRRHLLLFLGGISYTLYLVHDSLGRYLLLWLAKRINPDAAIFISLLVSIAAAALITFAFEKPLQRRLTGERV